MFLCRDRACAEEVTSETFVRVWLSSKEIREGTVVSYLFTIARNVWRQMQARQRTVEELGRELPDPKPDPYALSEMASDISAVRERVMTLPDVDRKALLMRVIDGTPYEEIARTLGITVASAKVKVHRARLLLANVI